MAIILVTVILSCFPMIAHSNEQDQLIKIGVLGFRSPEQTLTKWTPTAEYLTTSIAGYCFEMVPMNYPQVDQAVADKSIDFVLTNTGHYVSLETNYGISRIATLVKKYNNQPIKSFGGILFTASNRDDINEIPDLEGKRFMAVGRNSLGGFLVAWQQLHRAGIDPFSDFQELRFSGMPHDDVIRSVLRGDVDAGTVRTSIIEQMINEGKIHPSDIKILNRKTTPGFPFAHSTLLYPEWPFARLPHTEDSIAEKITVALLTLESNAPAAMKGGYYKWTTPLDYQPVHELFKELKTGPYEKFGSFTLRDVLKKHLVVITLFLLSFSILVALTLMLSRLNHSLKQALSEVKTLQGFLPICSSCKKIRDDTGYWNKIETYIKQHSDAEFSHSICPDCSEKLFSDYRESQKREIDSAG